MNSRKKVTVICFLYIIYYFNIICYLLFKLILFCNEVLVDKEKTAVIKVVVFF